MQVETTGETTLVEILVGLLKATPTVATAKGTMGAETAVKAVVGTEDEGIIVSPINVILNPERLKVLWLFKMASTFSCLLC